MKDSYKNLRQAKFSHDRLFKLFYSEPDLAQELFQLIFSKKELEAYDLAKLQVESNNLGSKKADLLFSLPFKQDSKTQLKVFILLEHKAFPDKKMFNQILDYLFLIRKKCLRETGRVQPVLAIVFYHGRQPLSWKRSLQEEDFGSFFDKIPIESRKSMLNYEPKIIDLKDSKIKSACGKLKGRGVIKLLSEIWSLKKEVDSFKLRDIYVEFEDLLRSLKGKEKERTQLTILNYLLDNTWIDNQTLKKAENLLVKDKIIKKGGLMKFKGIEDFIREKGRWEGLQKGIRQGRQKEQHIVISNMLKKQLDVSLISEVTGLSQKEIKKVKKSLCK